MGKICKSVFAFAIIFIISIHAASGQYSFEFGIESDEYCRLINADTDAYGNVILVGFVGSPSIDHKDAYILKVYPEGSYHEKRFALQDTISALMCIKVMDNGNYFLTGAINTDTAHNYRDKLWALTLDPDFNYSINKTYKIREGYSFFGFLANIVTDNFGDIILATSVEESETETRTQFSDFAFYKFNHDCDTLISKYYSYMFNEYPWDIVKVPNSDNLMIMERSTNPNNQKELMFIDTGLNILKVNPFESHSLEGQFSSHYWVNDTSFIMVADNRWDMGTYYEKYFAAYLVDTTATVHQELVFNKNDTIEYMATQNSMAYVNDTTIFVGGWHLHPGFPGNQDPSIIELYLIDKDMNLLGYKELGGDMSYMLFGVEPTPDNGCLLYGGSNTNPHEFELDIHIWKVLRDEINIITSVADVTEKNEKLKVYPNPVADILKIGIPERLINTQITISLFNLKGKKVYQETVTVNGNLVSSNLMNLMPGIYGLVITNENKTIYSSSIIKM